PGTSRASGTTSPTANSQNWLRTSLLLPLLLSERPFCWPHDALDGSGNGPILPWLCPESVTNESPKQPGNRMQSFSVMTFTVNPGTGLTACASCKGSCWV